MIRQDTHTPASDDDAGRREDGGMIHSIFSAGSTLNMGRLVDRGCKDWMLMQVQVRPSKSGGLSG